MIAKESERNLVEIDTHVSAQLRAFINAFGSVARFVWRPARLQQRLLAVGACAMCAGALVAGGGAETASRPDRRADRQSLSASLAEQRHTALLSLYALDAQLQRSQARISALRAQHDRVEHERASVRRQLAAAYSTLRTSQRRLAQRLHALYESGESDPLAVLLGASSLEEAITGLDDLRRSAQLDTRIADDARHARTQLRALAMRLSQRERRLEALAQSAERSVSSLTAIRLARTRFVNELTQRLNTLELSRLQAEAQASATRSHALVAATSAATQSQPVSAERAPVAGSTLTVVASGYALTGATASGIPPGWGVVAVDPAVIPLGTRMTIPGYGEGFAADTGPAVHGTAIDLWFPTVQQALSWGRRTVTITLH
jgi:3D (Asp-Asp-Asp) domain-containing protein